MKDRLLIVGGNGFLGGALQKHWQQNAREVIATSRNSPADEGVLRLDLSQPSDTWPALPQCRAAVLCAGITNLQQCRRDPAGTHWVNVTQTLKLSQRLVEQNCFVTFISSNLVFDGSRPLRRPDEPTCPRTEYGRQKAEVETGLASLGNRVGIVRLTKVVHPQWPLVRGWMQSLGEGKSISAFEDFMCSPIPLADTIRAIAAVAEKQLGGIWHLSAASDISYADVARQIARQLKKDPALVRQTSARGTATLEHLPQHTTLDASRSRQELGFEIPDPTFSIAQTFSA